MSEEKYAYFELMKRQNIKLIRNTLCQYGAMKIHDIANKTGLSYPTISKLVKELVNQNILCQCDVLEVNGGRPGAKYMINGEYKQAVIMYFEDNKLKCFVFDYSEKEVFDKEYEVNTEVSVDDIIHIIDKLLERYSNITTLIIGIPGAALDKEIVFLPIYPRLLGKELAGKCSDLGIDFFVENDTNAIAYAKKEGRNSFAHIAYINHCIGVGIVYEGRIMQGAHGYAGELEYLCTDMSDTTKTLATCILALTCVLDLPEIIISSDDNVIIDKTAIRTELTAQMPEYRIPKITIENNSQNKYKQGLRKRMIEQWRQE